MSKPRPHLLGIDDGPFEKHQPEAVPIVAVMMEGADLVETVAVSAFPVDGDDATGFLAAWIGGLRGLASAQALVLGGITVAGLGVVDVVELARRLDKPVLVATRRAPDDEPLTEALRSAGLDERIPIVERSPRAERMADGLFVAPAGCSAQEARHLVSACLRKASLPEPLRIAHMVARALVLGESRGRV
ncbi:MAG: DUF99 family protein [Myxococcota bacterium]